MSGAKIMQTMTPDEYRLFLTSKPRTGKLSTVRADGSPHVAPIWFAMDGEVLVFTTGAETIKGRNIRRDGRVSICVDDDAPPFAYVLFEGRASVATPSQDEFLMWATNIAGRYMGEALAASYGKRNAVEGELLIRVAPHKIIARKGISDW
jgi:PPOX class probable F420-dependent enzyme